jgi:hypothetical protein
MARRFNTLQEQPFQVLVLLLGHPGEVVTRGELRRQLWHAQAKGFGFLIRDGRIMSDVPAFLNGGFRKTALPSASFVHRALQGYVTV